ncbi:hypothetical protein GJ744_006469 [Endocarpon pusillum]|uniref:Transcription initiation factor TFIID subunit 9 n=1 Tax=Endocarpon pusillum TaxID=364733 RepID=A0A8H7AQY4_9EURO|nr:hypothetical protein GJ744_006469 [Endocarpon pusillum]
MASPVDPLSQQQQQQSQAQPLTPPAEPPNTATQTQTQTQTQSSTQQAPQPASSTTALPSHPATSLSDPGTTKRPRDARLIHLMLSSLGVSAYQERVPLQLLDFAYRYTSSVLGDAAHIQAEGWDGSGDAHAAGGGRVGTGKIGGGGGGGGSGGGASGGAGAGAGEAGERTRRRSLSLRSAWRLEVACSINTRPVCPRSF